MRHLLAIAYILASTSIACADVAPIQFTGTNVFPLKSAAVRMAAADVRIVWGEPCSLTANFRMVNESEHDVALEIGFPVGAFHLVGNDPRELEDEDDPKHKPLLEAVGRETITITINGEAARAYRRVPHEKIREIKWRYASWYFAEMIFRPGTNDVAVTTRLNPSGVYAQPFKRRLSYCISTGSRWQGSIGRETVEIKFPGMDVTPLLRSVTPASGVASKDTVRWVFEDFEPQGEEYDIELEFLAPSVVAKLNEIRTAYARAPQDTNAALRYAVHLFSLGHAKGNAGSPPERLTADEYQQIFAKTRNSRDRAEFTRHYQRSSNHYIAESSEWTPRRQRLVQIMADAGYCADYPEVTRVQEGRAIVEQCLAREPRNAAAWNVYLAHFWRFSFAARGHWFGPSVFSKPLCAAIESARKNCPDDPDIRAWHRAMQEDGEPPTYSQSFRFKPVAFQSEFEAASPVPED